MQLYLTVPQLRSLAEWARGARQREIIEAVIAANGDRTAAAETLGIPRSTVYSTIHYTTASAAKRGWLPTGESVSESRQVPPGYHVKGVSTLYGPEGETKLQWVKTNRDQERNFEALVAALEGIDLPKADPTPAPLYTREDLLCVLPMGDPHIGMHAWARETGHDFDVRIAQSNLFGAIDYLVECAPPAKFGLVANLGDFFHANNASNTTAKGTPLDVDTRWPKVVGIGLDVMIRAIRRSLEKFDHVTVITEIGNHDRDASVFLAIALERYFENEPRVYIDTSPAPYHWYRFGKCLIGTHHGDRASFKALPEIMAYDRKEDWGETEHRRWYVGHVHHESVKEHRGVTVETFRTLASSDAWHHASGYRSGRDMRCDVWHREDGLISRNIVGIKRVIAHVEQSKLEE